MKKCICLLAVFLMGCSPGVSSSGSGSGICLSLQEQTLAQLHLPAQQSRTPVVAAWLTADSLSDMLSGATELAFRQAVREELERLDAAVVAQWEAEESARPDRK